MARADTTNGCRTGHGDRTKVLVAIEPRAYRTVIGRAIQMLRPHLEVALVEPDDLSAEVAHLDPALVICGRPRPPTSDGERVWAVYRPYDETSAKVCVGGGCARLFDPNLDDLLSVVDGAERLFQKSPDLPAASCLASYGNGGEFSG
jgi:hypothetical protein